MGGPRFGLGEVGVINQIRGANRLAQPGVEILRRRLDINRAIAGRVHPGRDMHRVIIARLSRHLAGH